MDFSMNYTELARGIGEIILKHKAKRHKRFATQPGMDPETNETIFEENKISFCSLEQLSDEQFYNLMMMNGKRCIPNASPATMTDDFRSVERFINSMCHPRAMQITCEMYVDSLQKDTRNDARQD